MTILSTDWAARTLSDELAAKYTAQLLEELKGFKGFGLQSEDGERDHDKARVQITNLRNFLLACSGPLRVVSFTKILGRFENNHALLNELHQATVDLIMATFHVPMGKAGVGVIPKPSVVEKVETTMKSFKN